MWVTCHNECHHFWFDSVYEWPSRSYWVKENPWIGPDRIGRKKIHGLVMRDTGHVSIDFKLCGKHLRKRFRPWTSGPIAELRIHYWKVRDVDHLLLCFEIQLRWGVANFQQVIVHPMWSADGWPDVLHKLYFTKQTNLHNPAVNLTMWSLYQYYVKLPGSCDDHSKFLIHPFCKKAAKSMTQTCPTLTKFSLENVCKPQHMYISSATQLTSSHQEI